MPGRAAVPLLLVAIMGCAARFDVDGARALARVERQVAAGPRIPGTPGHAAVRAWLERELARPFAGPTVVVTHMLPSPRSVHPRFAESIVNPSFVSNAEHLLDGRRVALWIHGHAHDGFDYAVHGTRVLCNPRGHTRHGAIENDRFDPRLVVEVG